MARLDPDAPLPPWARGEFTSVTRTRHELSIVCAQAHVPADVRHERDRIGLAIEGLVPMASIGVMAGLCTALAAAGVSVFVVATFDTDWLLVTADRFEAARAALEAAGHVLHGAFPAL